MIIVDRFEGNFAVLETDSGMIDVEKGDKVEISTKYGIFTYEVDELIEFKKTSKKYVVPKDEEILTLYTCKPDVLGGSDMRIGAVCKITDKKFYKEPKGE